MSGPSSSTGAVDSVFLFIVGVSVFFLVLITFLMIFFIIKYNKKRHKTAEDIHGNTTLEIVWTVIPTFIVLIMFYLGWKGFGRMWNTRRRPWCRHRSRPFYLCKSRRRLRPPKRRLNPMRKSSPKWRPKNTTFQISSFVSPF